MFAYSGRLLLTPPPPAEKTTACQNIPGKPAPVIGLEHWTRRLVGGHSAQCLSAMTPMAMPRNNKENAGIQFGSNGTTYLHPVPGVKMA
jgi:hypothetical protein